MKNVTYKQHLTTTFRRLTQKTTVLRYMSTFWVHFTKLAPPYPFCTSSFASKNLTTFLDVQTRVK